MGRIFGVGLNKTGTRSLADALEVLGFTATHWGANDDLLRAHREGVPLLSYAPQTDAYLDLRAVERWFDVLDEQYPGSRFILTSRDLEPWLDSREQHVRRIQVKVAEGATNHWTEIDRVGWTRLWHEHHEAVRTYFAGRADLLEMDISKGDGWDVLCPFLRVDVPDEPWPWIGRSTWRRRIRTRVKALEHRLR